MGLERVRHRDRPVAPATKVAAPVDPPTRLYARRSCRRGTTTSSSSCSSGPATNPRCRWVAGLLRTKRNRLGPVMAVAVLLLDPPILVFATGPPTTQPADPVATTSRALPVIPRSRHPLRGRRRSRRLRRRQARPAEGSGPHRVGLHQVTDLVRSFTGGFTEQSMKATPGGADTKGTTAGPATTNGPSAEEHRSEAASADAA